MHQNDIKTECRHKLSYKNISVSLFIYTPIQVTNVFVNKYIMRCIY